MVTCDRTYRPDYTTLRTTLDAGTWEVRMQVCYNKLDGANVGDHELFTPASLMGGLKCRAVVENAR